MNYIDKILDYYTEMGIEKRMGGFIDQIGFETFQTKYFKTLNFFLKGKPKKFF